MLRTVLGKAQDMTVSSDPGLTVNYLLIIIIAFWSLNLLYLIGGTMLF